MGDSLVDVIQQIIIPGHDDPDDVLDEIGLGVIPSPELIHREIEAKLLFPPDTLSNHWLSTYQMYGFSYAGHISLIFLWVDTGRRTHLYPLFFHLSLHLHQPIWPSSALD